MTIADFRQTQRLYLKRWFAQHVHSPFLSAHDVSQLLIDTRLEKDQIQHWLCSERTRRWGDYSCPECGGGKHICEKPSRRRKRKFRETKESDGDETKESDDDEKSNGALVAATTAPAANGALAAATTAAAAAAVRAVDDTAVSVQESSKVKEIEILPFCTSCEIAHYWPFLPCANDTLLPFTPPLESLFVT